MTARTSKAARVSLPASLRRRLGGTAWTASRGRRAKGRGSRGCEGVAAKRFKPREHVSRVVGERDCFRLRLALFRCARMCGVVSANHGVQEWGTRDCRLQIADDRHTVGSSHSYTGHPLPTPPGGFGANCLFSMHWRQGSVVKYIVIKSLEAKFLKTESLYGLMCST